MSTQNRSGGGGREGEWGKLYLRSEEVLVITVNLHSIVALHKNQPQKDSTKDLCQEAKGQSFLQGKQHPNSKEQSQVMEAEEAPLKKPYLGSHGG